MTLTPSNYCVWLSLMLAFVVTLSTAPASLAFQFSISWSSSPISIRNTNISTQFSLDHPPVVPQGRRPRIQHHVQRGLHIMTDYDEIEYLDEDDFDINQDEIDFFLSPEQISFLRKEASKREARNKLPRYNLSTRSEGNERDTTSSPTMFLSKDILQSISKLFDQSELIEVRGISKDSKSRVYEMAHTFAKVLEDAYGIPVIVVQIQGFAVKLYRPWLTYKSSENDDDDKMSSAMREGKIQLRTKYKPGQWTRKPKPVRDSRGQIVTDENGKSVKEIPEE